MLILFVTILFSETRAAEFDPKTVNLQLEASVLVDPGDVFKYLPRAVEKLADFKLSDFNKLTDFHFSGRAKESSLDSKVLTKFLIDVNTELNDYKEETLKDLATILYDEVNDYYRRGARNDIVLDDKIKNYVTKRLKALADSNPEDLKQITRRFATSRRSEAPYESVASLNQFFNNKDTNTFDRLIKKLHYSSKLGNKDKISETIKETLEFLIIERYNNMNVTEKERFSNELHKLVGDEAASTNIFDTFKTMVDNALRQYIGGLFGNNKPTEPNQGEGKHENENKKRFRNNEESLSNRNEVEDKGDRIHSKQEHKPYSEFYK